jgi:hypothetical protein
MRTVGHGGKIRAKRQRICELTYEQEFNKSPEEWQMLCASVPVAEPRMLVALTTTLEQLRRKLGDAERAPPDWFA